MIETLRAAALVAVWVHACTSRPCEATEPVDTTASWRQGVSRWNGQSYAVEPSAPRAEPMPKSQTYTPSATGRPTTTTPYTLPLDPAAAVGPSHQIAQAPDRSGNTSLDDGFASPFVDYQNGDYQSSPLSGDSVADASGTLQLESPAGSSSADGASLDPLLPGLDDPSTAKSIDEKLAEAEQSDPLPLEDDVMQWYEYPATWMKGWDSHAEFGLDGSSGNADTLALQTGLELDRKTKHSTFAIDVDYRQASNRNRTVEDNGRFNVDYDYIFKESSWSGFGKYGMEWDKFKAFDLRLNLNGGLGYYWVREKHASFVTRFGAGASKEIGAPDDDWVPEAVFGIQGERQLTERQKIKGKVEYFPAWTNFHDFRLVSDAAWEILLDDSDNLSLKLAVTDRYDSTPQGAEPNDVYYSLLLLYKF